MNALSQDIIIYISLKMVLTDILSFSLINKRFNNIINNNTLWINKLLNEYNISYYTIPDNYSPKKYYLYINNILSCDSSDKYFITELENGNLNLIKLLHKNGANINIWNGLPFRLACIYGHLEIVKYLNGYNIDLHAMQELGLRLACEAGNLNIVKYLVEHGCNIHVLHNSPLLLAFEQGHTDIVNYINTIFNTTV